MRTIIITRNCLLLLLFSFLSVNNCIAQQQNVELGFSAGGVASTLVAYKKSSVQDASSYSGADRPVLSGYGELTVGVNLANNLTIRTGLIYKGKGGGYDYSYQSGHYNQRFYYTSLPVTLVKNFATTKSSFYVGGGGYAAYMIKGMVKNRQFGPLGAPIDPPVYNERYKRADFGLKLSAGYRPVKRISLDFGYDIGINNILKNDSNNWLANHSLNVGLGYKIN